MVAKKNKEVTLVEFKAWLEGVEELQPKNWCPDATQWKLIRNKIKNIIVEEPQQQSPSLYDGPGGGNLTTPPRPSFTPPPPIKSSLEDISITPPSPKAAQLLTGDTRITPDIDTSDGSYASSFT